jgi:hypothetical protein
MAGAFVSCNGLLAAESRSIARTLVIERGGNTDERIQNR